MRPIIRYYGSEKAAGGAVLVQQWQGRQHPAGIHAGYKIEKAVQNAEVAAEQAGNVRQNMQAQVFIAGRYGRQASRARSQRKEERQKYSSLFQKSSVMAGRNAETAERGTQQVTNEVERESSSRSRVEVRSIQHHKRARQQAGATAEPSKRGR